MQSRDLVFMTRLRATGEQLKILWPWVAAGVALATPLILVTWISDRFAQGSQAPGLPTVEVALLLIWAGTVYLGIQHWGKKSIPRGWALAWVLALGLSLRLIMFATSPILEDDHHRYLWDGAVLAAGYSPYAYAPAEFLKNDPRGLPPELLLLASEQRATLERINYPHLRTIYPPVAQAFFALAHWLKPFSLDAWRLVLLFLDGITLWLIFLLLKEFGLGPLGLVVYWWNPLLIKEIYNSGHMDLVVLPLAAGGLLLAARARWLWASGFLGLAAAAKFWPLALAPVLLRPLFKEPAKFLTAAGLILGMSLLSLAPFISGGLAEDVGLTAYGRGWEMNDSAFMLFVWTAQSLGLDWAQAQTAARAATVMILAGWGLWLVRRDDPAPRATLRRMLAITGALFLLSPTQFPWYYLWLLPFLALYPSWGLLLLTASLPLYYLRFHWEALGETVFFDHWVVWLEFLPVWALLAWEFLRFTRAAEPN